jgi:hypothetical protein
VHRQALLPGLDSWKNPAIGQPATSDEKKTTLRGPSLYGQHFPSFAATGAQHLASVLRAHPLAKTVNLFAFAHVRLKRRTHKSHLPAIRLNRLMFFNLIMFLRQSQ